MPSSTKSKGKARAIEPSERDSLLATGSGSGTCQAEERPRTPSRIRSALLTVGIILFSLCLSSLLFILLLAASYRPSPSELENLPKTAFRYTQPDSVSLIKLDDDGILLNVSLRCGIDADRALTLGFDDSPRVPGAQWWEDLRRWTAHRALSSLPAEVEVELPDAILASLGKEQLVSLRVLQKLPIAIIPGADKSTDWLKHIHFTVMARPLSSTGELWRQAQQIWAAGHASVDISVPTAVAKYSLPWLSRYGTFKRENLNLAVDVPVPRLPGLPPPGRPLDPATLVTLKEYTFHTEDSALVLNAMATLPNFAPSLNITLPFALPFRIGIPSDGGEQRMAEVITKPIKLDGSDSIALHITGHVDVDLHTGNGSSPLSTFFQRYLHGKGNPIIIHGLAGLPAFARGAEAPPKWMLSTLPTLSVPLIFPGPNPPPKVIHSVNIDKMRISEAGGKMLASGTVIAEIDLPANMEHVDVEVSGVIPDVLVFDGPATEDVPGEEYPPRAFGHIRPESWLAAESRLSDNPFYPYRLVVTAPLENVPLDILPGRDGILRGFISKVVFKGGAMAGIRGKASVNAEIAGIRGSVRLDDLPVIGSTWVGRH